jgi:TrmH family RNA methyltransferase
MALPGGEITDIRSPRVKAAMRLQKRSFREHDKAFLAEGAQAVREALAVSAPAGVVREIFCTAQASERSAHLISQARERGVPVHQASGRVLAELSDTVTPQGLIAVCDLIHVEFEQALAAAPADIAAATGADGARTHAARLVVLLSAVRDPGNAGTVLRTADAAGADAVAFSDSSVDPYNGKCVRASAGSIFHLPIAIGVQILPAIDDLRRRGYQVFAADGAPPTESLDAIERAGILAKPTAWIFGNEAWGLPPAILQAADRTVGVPIHGRAESLNLAAAAAVCLYASARAQRAATSESQR